MQSETPCIPLVSVVVPAYNHARYLRQAIDSVLEQDYPGIELIVLDDGSQDESADILRSYPAGAFYWETQTNLGQSRTLNKGWGLAHGEVLTYLSADDVLYPGAVRRAVETLKSNHSAIATYCDFHLLSPTSGVVRNVSTPEFSFQKMVCEVQCLPGPGAFFRREAFVATGGWNADYRQMPDYDFWLRVGLLGPFARIPELLAGYRVHEGSQTFSRLSVERAEEPCAIVRAFLERPDVPAEVLAARSQAISRSLLIAAQLHWRAGRRKVALKRLADALRERSTCLLSPTVLRMAANACCNRWLHATLWRSTPGNSQSVSSPALVDPQASTIDRQSAA